MNNADKLRLAIASVFAVAAVILSLYGDMVGVSMMTAAGLAVFLNYVLRRIILKEEIKKDEMTKRISSISSEFALLVTICVIGILTIMLHFRPALLDAFEVMGILIAVIIISKITVQLYYVKISKEIDF
ncbi:MAG TPA: hypothetical protein VIO11_11505 [Candidatus Methanoperedens sp.]